MKRQLFLIFIGLAFLVIILFIGSPFEFLNVSADTFATFAIILLFILLFTILYNKIKQLDNKVFKRTALGVFIVIAIPYFFVAVWTAFLTWSNYHPMWQDLFIYTNSKNEKVISEWRMTSGSIYDYRDRKIIVDYRWFRVSFDCNAKKLKGVWTQFDCRDKKTTIINFDHK